MKKLLLGGVLLVGVGGLGWANVAQLAQEVEKLALGKSAFAAEGREVTVGQLTLRLASGTVAPVLVGERQVGWFFTGSGEALFTLADALAQPVFKYNVEKATSLALEGNDKLRMPVADALLLTSGPPEALF